MPERVSEDVPDRMSKDMPESMSEDMPEIMPERMSDGRMSEDMQKPCQEITFQYMPGNLSG